MFINGPVNTQNVPANSQNDMRPSDSFAWTWAYDPIIASSGFLAVNGTLYLIRCNVRELPTPFTDVLWAHTVVGAGPVAGQNWAGLYTSAGVRVAQLGIDGTLTTLGSRNAVFPSTNVNVPDFVWVGLLFNAATPPTLLAAGGQSVNMVNFGIMAFPAFARNATAGTGLTTLPTSINPATNVPIGQSIWAAAG